MEGLPRTREYCLVDEPLAYTGTKKEIVNKLFDNYSIKNGEVHYTLKHHIPSKMNHSYGDDWIAEELEKEVISELFKILLGNGYTCYTRTF